MADEARIAVVGVGNPLKLDEGVGVRVAEELMSRWDFQGAADIVDAGTMGMSMLPIFQEYDVVIVADAMDGSGLDAGTVVVMTPDEIAPNQVMHSLHDMRLPDVLAAAEIIGCSAEVRVVAVQIQEMSADAKVGLTEPVEAAVPDAVRAVLDMLAEHGVNPQPRTEPSPEAAMLRALRTGEDMPDMAPASGPATGSAPQGPETA